MYLIGLTGGIASGKSTVSRMLIHFGAALIDADEIAREVVQPGQPAWQDIVRHFGEAFLLPDRTLDRLKLGKRIFDHREEKLWLDQITHPRIEAAVLMHIASYRQAGARVTVLDVPLLFEAGWQRYVDEIWVTAVDPAVQLDRLCRRNHLTAAEAQSRMECQIPLAEKIRRADFVIDNNGTLRETEVQVTQGWRRVLEEKMDGLNESDSHAPQ